MRALVCSGFGSGENLSLQERPMPEPGDGEIRVRVLACGANASDWEFVTGTPSYARIARWFMRGRDVFGSDVLGVVDKLGPGATRFRIGDRVRRHHGHLRWLCRVLRRPGSALGAGAGSRI